MKKINSKKMKIIWGSLGAAALMVPTIAVSAVACSNQNSSTQTKINITSQPENQVAVVGQTEKLPTFFVKVGNLPDVKLNYQWYSNTKNSTEGATKIDGATTNAYTVTTDNVKTAGTTYFFVEIGGTENGNNLKTITSNIVSLTVNTLPSIVIKNQPIANQTAIVNQTQNLPSLSITVANISGAILNYQWYESNTNSTTDGNEISGATNSSYIIPSSDLTTAATKYYFVKISGTLNGVALTPITSSVASLNVLASLPTINIKTQPTNQTVYANQTAAFPTFSVVAGPIEGATFTYQWYENSSNSTTGGTAIAGATSSYYAITKSDIGTVDATKYFYATINGSINNLKLVPVNSDVVSLTIKAASTITISAQPTAEQVVAKDASVTLNFTATSSNSNTLTYQWQKSNSNAADATWTDIPEANSNTYTFTDANEPGTVSYYRIIVSETNTDATATSNVAKVSVGYANAAAATTVLNTWLASQNNQKSLLESYFKTSNPLSIIGGTTGSNTSLSVPLWSYQFNTVPTATLNNLTFVEKNTTNNLPFSTWEVQVTTTTAGTYQVWSESSNAWGNSISIPIGSKFTIYLPFDLTKAVTNTSSTITPVTTLTNNSSTLTFSITTKIPYGVVGGSFTPAGENQTTVNWTFANPTFYSFNNTNSDLPALPILASSNS